MITMQRNRRWASLGNFITLGRVITGSHKLPEQAIPVYDRYSPDGALTDHFGFSNDATAGGKKRHKKIINDSNC